MKIFQIDHSHGTTEGPFDTYEAAVREVYVDCIVGHAGDILDGGNRTLIWRDEESSVNDDGSCAVCSIRQLHD